MAGTSLILGSTGQLGTAFRRLVEHPVPLTRQQLDLASATVLDARRVLESVQPSVVINCAAYTAVDKAESEEALATRVNGKAVGYLATAADELGVPFVTFSTDYVFNGRGARPYLESDPPDPVNAYGRSKLLGEQEALRFPGSLVVRTSWVLSATHRNFVTAIFGAVSSGREVRVVDDQRGCPTIVDDLAKATVEAVDAGVRGLLHLTNQGETTWFGLARAALEAVGWDPNLISPCTTDEYPTAARRPSYSVLGSEVVERSGIAPLPPWQDSIERVARGSIALIAQ